MSSKKGMNKLWEAQTRECPATSSFLFENRASYSKLHHRFSAALLSGN